LFEIDARIIAIGVCGTGVVWGLLILNSSPFW